MNKKERLTNNSGAIVGDNRNVQTAGPHGPMLMQNVWYMEKLGHFNRERIPERVVHAKGSGAFRDPPQCECPLYSGWRACGNKRWKARFL